MEEERTAANQQDKGNTVRPLRRVQRRGGLQSLTMIPHYLLQNKHNHSHLQIPEEIRVLLRLPLAFNPLTRQQSGVD
jgi:hypothetical protein